MNQISPELAKKLTRAVEKMPAFPKSVQKILELTRNLDCEPKHLVQQARMKWNGIRGC